MLEHLPVAAMAPQGRWSQALLEHMDWLHFQQLVTRMLHRSGYIAEVSWVRPDGASGLALLQGGRPGPPEAIVHCTPWGARETGGSGMPAFAESIQGAGAARGLWITPAVFHDSARDAARDLPVELVEGRDLLWALQRMSPSESDFLWEMTTVGPWMTPSCPACLAKMELSTESDLLANQPKLDADFRDVALESREIDCRSLTIRKKADVTFLKAVTAGSMTVHGKVTGNFVVNGTLRIAPGGFVHGLVSARGIVLNPGGTLEAEARILNECDLQPIRPLPAKHLWKCPGWPKCRSTLPVC